jgi:pilus assembly protein CpaE
MGGLAAILAHQGSNLCFLDVVSQPDQALPLVSETAAAGVPVVVLNPQKDADLILRCLRLGATEFLAEPAVDQVSELLARLSRPNIPADNPKKSLAVCIVPGKPGSGASTLATHLALEMKRGGASRVLLVDTDPVAGAVAFLLKLKASYHLGDALRDWNRMDADLWSRLVSHCHGIDVLPAPEDPTTRLDFDQQSASALVAFWRKHYDAVVIDIASAAAGANEYVSHADSVLVVTTNDLPSVHATQRSLELMQRGAADKSRIKLIITRYAASMGLKREEVETALKLPPYALLRNDWDAVQSALVDGTALSASSHFGLGVRTLGERLLGREKAAKKRSPFFGLLAAK